MEAARFNRVESLAAETLAKSVDTGDSGYGAELPDSMRNINTTERGPALVHGAVECRGPARSGFGDLTIVEVDQIQSVVDDAGSAVWVGGSAARGNRRNAHNTELPIGKGPETRSDIDYFISGNNLTMPSAAALDRLPCAGHRPLIVDGEGSYSQALQLALFTGHRIEFAPGKRPEAYSPPEA